AYKHEQEHALATGCRFVFQVQPTRIVGESRVEGIELVRQHLGQPDASGKSSMQPIAGSEFVIPCDLVIKATGQSPHLALLEQLPGVELRKGLPVVDERFQTSNPRYFAAGDCVSGGQEVVNAVAEGKRAAQSIVDYFATKEKA